MNTALCLNLAYEDDLSGVVLDQILVASGRPFSVGARYCRGGYGYLKRIVAGLNNAASGMPYLVLTDLDATECPPSLIERWLPQPKHRNLLLRVAVREVEAWLIADREALAHFLGVPEEHIPADPESLVDPKQELIRLASKSKRRELREDIVPRSGSTSKQGPDYNGRMSEFVEHHWNPRRAASHSLSLSRTLEIVASHEFICDPDAYQ